MPLFGPPNIQELKRKQDVSGLIKALRYWKKDLNVSIAASLALREIEDARAVKPLLMALQDQDGFVRAAVVKRLGEIGDARAVEPLVAALQDQDDGVRQAAGNALAAQHPGI